MDKEKRMNSSTDAEGTVFFYPTEAADITPKMLELAEEVNDSWFDSDEPIDWEEFIDRLCQWSVMQEPKWEFDDYCNPAVEKIKRHIRAYRRG
jgi:hypothetical protein